MRVCGIICEYNPFHKGHALHLARARAQSGADFIVCAMSGPVTQRGAFARHDKWTRARMALLSGADLVLELPVRFACASAQDFSAGGVALLESLGVLTHLSFGCEPQAIPLLGRTVSALRQEDETFLCALHEGLSRGLSYPQARADAACLADPAIADVLSQPNATLAVEYLCALSSTVTPVPIPREGGGYHSHACGPLASASAVRESLCMGRLEEALESIPHPELLRQAEEARAVHEEEALTQALLYRLRTLDAASLLQIAGMDEGLEHRFLRAAATAETRDALISSVKTRRYTYVRLSRLCSCILLGITRELSAVRRPGYARLLGFRKSAAPLLHAIKRQASLPLIAKAADYDRGDPLFALDVRAQDLWSLGCTQRALRASGRDFLTSPVVV